MRKYQFMNRLFLQKKACPSKFKLYLFQYGLDVRVKETLKAHHKCFSVVYILICTHGGHPYKEVQYTNSHTIVILQTPTVDKTKNASIHIHSAAHSYIGCV